MGLAQVSKSNHPFGHVCGKFQLMVDLFFYCVLLHNPQRYRILTHVILLFRSMSARCRYSSGFLWQYL